MKTPSVSVVGVGYVGARLCDALEHRGFVVQRVGRGQAPTGTHIFSTVAPSETDDPILAAHREALQAAQWLGYFSTTGVYGDTANEVAYEDHALAPNNARRRLRVNSEAAWSALGPPLCIMRLAGIYGPGRSALDQLNAGRARRVEKPGKVFNRIHVDDIVNLAVAALDKEATGVFNFSDSNPRPQREPVEHAARLLGIEPPPLVHFEDLEMSPMMKSFYDGNTRVGSIRLRELGELKYKDVLEGLDAIFTAE